MRSGLTFRLFRNVALNLNNQLIEQTVVEISFSGLKFSFSEALYEFHICRAGKHKSGGARTVLGVRNWNKDIRRISLCIARVVFAAVAGHADHQESLSDYSLRGQLHE